MGIRFQCPGCRRPLNVKSYLAGKRGICPKCTERFTIPESSRVESEPNRARWAGTGAESETQQAVAPSAGKASSSGNPLPHQATTGKATTGKPAGHESVRRDPKNFENFEATLSEFVAQHEDSVDEVAVEGNDAGSQPAAGAQSDSGIQPREEFGATGAPGNTFPATAAQPQRARPESPPRRPVAPINSRPSKPAAALPTQSGKPSPDWDDQGVTAPSVASQPQAAVGQVGEPFESLDAHSFELDRPQQEAASHPTGYYDWIAEAPQAVWYVRHSNGAQYGPAIGRQMRAWVDEGRVAEGCHVWREGWANWRQAVDVFPQIRPRGTQTADVTPVTAPAAPEPEAPGQRHGNRWLFPAVLLFLAVVAIVLGVVIYIVMNQRVPEEGVPDLPPENPGEIVDPFASSSLLPRSLQLR